MPTTLTGVARVHGLVAMAACGGLPVAALAPSNGQEGKDS